MNDTNLNPRQQYIVNLINQSENIGRLAIEEELEKVHPASKPTVARDLTRLLQQELIRTTGKGKNTVYAAFSDNPLLRPFNLDPYFLLGPDLRDGVVKNDLLCTRNVL